MKDCSDGAWWRQTAARNACLLLTRCYTCPMPTIDIDGQELFYARNSGRHSGRHDAAEPHATNLILLHGAGGSRLVWPAQLRRLATATVTVLDLPGHGRSAGPGRASIDAYAGVLASFIKRLDLAPAVVAGHSMGGAIAQLLALTHPALLKGMVLLATGARLRVNPAILEQIRTDFEAATSVILDNYWGPEAPGPLVENGQRLLLKNDPDVLFGDFVACDAFDVTERLAAIDIPALVISGTEDRLAPAKYGRYLADHLPNARLVLVEDGGHMLMLEKAPLVAGAVQTFLDRLSNATEA